VGTADVVDTASAPDSAAPLADDRISGSTGFTTADPVVSSVNLAEVQDTLQGVAFQVEDADEENDDETFSLRTLSMARVLAEQGDVREAMEICNELQAATEDADELARIGALQDSLEAGVSPAVAQEDGAPSQAKNRLIDTLESLAERLEARAAG